MPTECNTYYAHNTRLGLFPGARGLCPCLLPFLICLTQSIVQCLDARYLRPPVLPFLLRLQLADQLQERLALEELVVPVVQRTPADVRLRLCARHPKDLLQDVNVIGDAKQVSAVLVRKQIVELAKPRPGDAAETQAARLVRRQEDAVRLRTRPRDRIREAPGEEFLDAVDFAV